MNCKKKVKKRSTVKTRFLHCRKENEIWQQCLWMCNIEIRWSNASEEKPRRRNKLGSRVGKLFINKWLLEQIPMYCMCAGAALSMLGPVTFIIYQIFSGKTFRKPWEWTTQQRYFIMLLLFLPSLWY